MAAKRGPMTDGWKEDLLNALSIAEMGRDGFVEGVSRTAPATLAFGDIARLIRNALMKLDDANPR